MKESTSEKTSDSIFEKSMNYSIQNIAKVIKADSRLTFPEDIISRISIDSRKIKKGLPCLFVAIHSGRRDGHDFIAEAYKKGCRNFLVEYIPEHSFEANFLVVKKTIPALQQLAKEHRRQFEIPVVGITGSNAKTIVKDWSTSLLQTKHQVVKSPGSFNSQIGVPLAVLQMEQTHDIAIFEAGISQKNEMQSLQPIVKCNYGIFTNIGDAHNEGFTDRAEKIEEKLKLFDEHCKIIFCADHEAIHAAIKNKGAQHISWSRSGAAADYQVKIIDQPSGATLLSFDSAQQKFQLALPFQDKASLENAIHAIILALSLGLSTDQIQQNAQLLEPINMRLSLHQGKNRNLLIQDYYNADLEGLEAAMQFMEQQSGSLKRVLVLSDILGSRQDQKLFDNIQDLIQSYKIDQFIGIGKNLYAQKDFFQCNEKHFYQTAKAFRHELINISLFDSVILLKGSRSFEFEKIYARLSGSTHRTKLEINLSDLKGNLDFFKTRIPPTTKIMAMVKASAYGSGSIELSKWLEREKVDYLGVAYPDEGIKLRQAGVQLPIMVLSPAIDRIEELINNDLEPEIYNFDLLNAFLPYQHQLKGVHLKIDTGMHRLGFIAKDWSRLIAVLQKNPALKVLSIFSHLVASEDSEFDELSEEQNRLFLAGYQQITQQLGYRPMKHLLNSGGILRHSQYAYDMVRLGMGLYGYSGIEVYKHYLTPIFALKGQVVQIKELEAGETVGYGAAQKVDRATRIGIINIGYADGLLRKAGLGRFKLWIERKTYPTIGNICMDMCMVDLGHENSVFEGQSATIFSANHDIQLLAEALETIPYEVLTNISPRVPRIYIQD